ncbi:ATP-binding response regulator [Paenibacillus crassostreae]|uniref:histidine kinase n=1 Tax=Paenibacillus crassostreae TaxID=1763538 RepID=A0A167GBC9_9BACL|nr:ATP-binding protein [Paenibacillus crassostreae]AOZ92642.1 hypothetical protein LPB68_10695 [Paenibacillus crassostreae]OAB77411.1 hypothetical protein PNBC_01690 [Paenibacillus crassostreae]
MNRFKEYIKHSINIRIITIMMVGFTLILVGASVMALSTITIIRNYDDKINNMNRSHDHISDIANQTNEIILRVRGYFAYLDRYEYEQIFNVKKELDRSISSFKSTPLSSEEAKLVRNVENFFDEYLMSILPQGLVFAEKGDYDALRNLITLGVNSPVNEIISFAHESEKEIRVQLKNENEILLEKLFFRGVSFIVYTIMVLFLSIYMSRKLSKDIGNPLRQLSRYAMYYAEGDKIQPDILERKDEIGHLSRSLNNMIYEIQEKNEELLAQNEELLSQQDELQAQQDELQQALIQMEENESYLNKRYVFTQSIANTLDKKELLHSIIRNMVEVTSSEKGILILMNETQDHAAHGISQEEISQFMNGFMQSAAIRSLYSKQLYLRERDATPGEKGYISEPLSAYDLFLPIYKGDGNITACMVLTRVGKCFGDRDQKEIISLVGQISLSLEKLEMFEATEGQRQLTQDMMNTIQEGVQFMNLNGQSLQVNHKLYELMGLSYVDSELDGMSLQDFMALLAPRIEDFKSLYEFIENALSDNLGQIQSLNYVLKGEETRYIQIYWEPIYHNKQKFGILLVHRDITKEYEVDRMKSEFVSTVSHELRTPLASILGFSELMLHRELNPERQRKYTATIHQEANRLTLLVNDFLDLQRMENGMQFYDFRPVDMIHLIEEVKEIQQASTTHHRIISNSSHEKMVVLGDRDKLYQAMVNLVSNAIKYSPDGGDIIIFSHQMGDNIWIEITDKGLGIPAQAISSLFTKFYRVDSSDRSKIGGTGLGLAIVKEIVSHHQGDVSVKSQLGEGSSFSIILPIYKSDIAPISTSQLSTNIGEDTPVNVMLVENDINLAGMLQEELVEKGYRTTIYSDGVNAIRAMEEQPPHIIVLDLKLSPEVSGWGVIERMKSSEQLKSIPIIISSAFEDKGRALQMGISHFLIKPYVTVKLFEAIEDILSIRKI